MNKLQELLQPVLNDSFGGVMYNVANRNKYDTTEILKAWAELSAAEQESVGGIIKGAINFVSGN